MGLALKKVALLNRSLPIISMKKRTKKEPIKIEEPVKMTAAEFVKKFVEDIACTADDAWRDDKEGDYSHKGVAAAVALEFTADDHEEISVTDLLEVKDEMHDNENHPLARMIWAKVKK